MIDSSSSTVAQPSQPTAAGPMPPDKHWAVVLVISMVTLGAFGIYWTHKQVEFVKKIDAASNAMQLWLGFAACWAAQVVLYLLSFVLGLAGLTSVVGLLSLLSSLASLALVVFLIMMAFGMRTSLEKYYNSVESIGLRLSPVMTFFFNVTYFQYHFSRIAALKMSQPVTA